MARFVLTPFGSGGDVNPHLWLGKLLVARGHEVRVITVPMFREAAVKAGLAFTGIGKDEDYLSILHDPALWRPFAGTKLVLQQSLIALPLFFKAIADEVARGPVVLVSPFHQFAARAAREKFGVPLVTVHLQPSCFLSAWDMPVFFSWMEPLRLLPRWMKRLFLTAANPANQMVGAGLKKFCAGIGIRAPARLIPDWLHSPDANLALFPEWFAAPQPDWPSNTRATGFPQEDLRGQFALPKEIQDFLAAGDKPLVFSPGTGNAQSRNFFAAGLDACEKLGKRALLGTRFQEQLPQRLPSWAKVFEYLPFSEVLPHVDALVHHGGIGTMSQALAAGVPQLIMPMAHDQPDNAVRLKRLGCGSALTPRKFTVKNISRELEHLLSDTTVKVNCGRVARLCREDDAGSMTVEVLEGVGARGP